MSLRAAWLVAVDYLLALSIFFERFTSNARIHADSLLVSRKSRHLCENIHMPTPGYVTVVSLLRTWKRKKKSGGGKRLRYAQESSLRICPRITKLPSNILVESARYEASHESTQVPWTQATPNYCCCCCWHSSFVST